VEEAPEHRPAEYDPRVISRRSGIPALAKDMISPFGTLIGSELVEGLDDLDAHRDAIHCFG
jgi:hypothetical protein